MSCSKKRILLINRYFEVGGIQSSLINMANSLCEDYDVDIFAYYPEGVLKERLDSRVNIIESSWRFKALGMSLSAALRSGSLRVILFRVFSALWARFWGNKLPISLALKHQKKLKGYDLAIAYRTETRKEIVTSGFSRVLDKCIEAKTKAVWIHCDAEMINVSKDYNEKYYRCADKIVGVSKSVMKIFESVYPCFSDKMDYCYNFMDYDKIISKSNEQQSTVYPKEKLICFSACRLSEEKGLVRAIKAFAPVFKEHGDILWYIAGNGPERENIESAIKDEGLEGRIILLGNQSNPYPYMKNADLLLSLSYHEAAPMVYMEAKALRVPVFSTETSSSREMLKDGVEDFICENSESGIRGRFSEIMSDRNQVVCAKKKLENYNGSNDDSLEKIAEWIS